MKTKKIYEMAVRRAEARNKRWKKKREKKKNKKVTMATIATKVTKVRKKKKGRDKWGEGKTHISKARKRFSKGH